MDSRDLTVGDILASRDDILNTSAAMEGFRHDPLLETPDMDLGPSRSRRERIMTTDEIPVGRRDGPSPRTPARDDLMVSYPDRPGGNGGAADGRHRIRAVRPDEDERETLAPNPSSEP